jgi:hypothetical protein
MVKERRLWVKKEEESQRKKVMGNAVMVMSHKETE